jgi:hypothetical protein
VSKNPATSDVNQHKTQATNKTPKQPTRHQQDPNAQATTYPPPTRFANCRLHNHLQLKHHRYRQHRRTLSYCYYQRRILLSQSPRTPSDIHQLTAAFAALGPQTHENLL